MPDAAPRSLAPWIVATIAGLAFVALLVVFIVPLNDSRKNFVAGALTSDEQRAMNAASTETVNILTLSRKNFAGDYKRALSGATGKLAADIKAKRSAYQQTLTQGKFDTTASITNQALVGPTTTGHGYVVLLTVNSIKSSAPETPIPYHLQVDVVLKNGTYLANDLQSIEVS